MSRHDDSTTDGGINRRRVLGALGGIAGASAFGGGTSALFWDEEMFGSMETPNVLQAGSLDLKVDWEVYYYDDRDSTPQLVSSSDTDEDGEPNQVDQPGPIVNLQDVKPGDVVEHTLSYHVYDNPAFVTMGGEILADSDNGITEPEDKVNGHEPDGSDGDPFDPNGGQAAGLGLLGGGLLAGAAPDGVRSRVSDALSGKSRLRAAGALGAGLAGVGALSGTASAQTTAISVTDLTDPGLTPQDLAQSLVADESGVTVEDVRFNPQASGNESPGGDVAAGTFSGAGGVLGIEDGIILSSGRAADVIGPNESESTTTDLGTPGDGDLDVLAGSGNETFNATVLEIDFTVPEDAEKVFFNYVFGSEEYNEYVGSEFNDVFGFFLNPDSGTAEETNIAVIDDPEVSGEDTVAINNINNNENAELYVDNTNNDYDTEMDGFTAVLDVNGAVDVEGTNTLKLAVSDTSDAILDSWVLLEGGSLSDEPPQEGGDGELDNLMECVVWHDGDLDGDDDSADPGNNFPEEITDYTPGQQAQFFEDLANGDVAFDMESDDFVFRGSVRELYNEMADGLALDPGDDVADAFPDANCFRPSTTHYLGMLCWLPRDIPGYNDNIVQTDRLEYTFGFNAIQCRHNVGEGGEPMDANLDAADDEAVNETANGG